jgi:hypothetical protein
MFDDLDETIRRLLMAEMPVKNGEVEISFDQPKREWSARQSKPTLNLFLYDIRENNILRQHQWERLPGNGNDGKAHLKRMPFRVDCTYMITTWVSVPADDHRLLARCLMALLRFPILPEDRLVGSIRNPPFDIQARLASHDKLTNPAEVWASLDNEMRPGISYVVTLALDPWKEEEVPMVRTLTLESGQATGLQQEVPRPGPGRILSQDISGRYETVRLVEKLDPGASEGEIHLIGGTVGAKENKNQPLAGITVAVKGTGRFSTTDDRGRFILGALPGGEYTLVAWQAEGKPFEQVVTVPTQEGNYDILL